MLDPLVYLQDPELVARFQRRCGLFLVEDAHHSLNATHPSKGSAVGTDKPCGQLRIRRDTQDKNSNFKHEANGYVTDVSRLPVGELAPLNS